MKCDHLTEGSETSANINQTPGNHPKVDILITEHSESLKSRILIPFHTGIRKNVQTNSSMGRVTGLVNNKFIKSTNTSKKLCGASDNI
jgi:hypothetical protein